MAKKRIGYDIDNVVTQTYDFALRLVNRHLGTSYTLEDCYHQTVEESFSIPEEDVINWFRKTDNGFPIDILPIDGAKDVINAHHGSLDQYFITARGASLIDGSLKWFDEHGFLYAPDRMFFKNNTPEKKANLVKAYNIELFVEDNLPNANAIAEEAQVPVLLVDFGYKFNRNRPYYHGLVKIVKSWAEIDLKIKELLYPL